MFKMEQEELLVTTSLFIMGHEQLLDNTFVYDRPGGIIDVIKLSK